MIVAPITDREPVIETLFDEKGRVDLAAGADLTGQPVARESLYRRIIDEMAFAAFAASHDVVLQYGGIELREGSKDDATRYRLARLGASYHRVDHLSCPLERKLRALCRFADFLEIEFLHLQHRVNGACALFGVVVAEILAQALRNDVPRKAELVAQPPAPLNLAALG